MPRLFFDGDLNTTSGDHTTSRLSWFANRIMHSGVPDITDQHAHKIAELAIGMQKSIHELSEKTETRLQLRIGIATGPITAGVIGRAKFAYDVWAPTVNLAARLESHGEAGRIHVSHETKRDLESLYRFEQAPANNIKGIGRLTTWY